MTLFRLWTARAALGLGIIVTLYGVVILSLTFLVSGVALICISHIATLLGETLTQSRMQVSLLRAAHRRAEGLSGADDVIVAEMIAEGETHVQDTPVTRTADVRERVGVWSDPESAVEPYEQRRRRAGT